MLSLKSFTFNPFQENTYILYEENGNAFIIDAGNSTATEHRDLHGFISEKKLKPTKLLLTHAHIDHIMGARNVHETYGLLPEVHESEKFFIERMPESAKMYGLNCEPCPMPEKWLKAGDTIALGKYELECLFTPGHSPGSISFFNKANGLLLGGDVLFSGSIGRSDLPMGDHETLIRSIRDTLLPLGDEVKVYPGHGPMTTIGRERQSNPFLT